MAQFPIAPPPGPSSSGNIFPIPPSKEKQALIARQFAEDMRDDGIDAVYVDAPPRGSIPASLRYDHASERAEVKRVAHLNATHPDYWSITTTRGNRYFTPRHYVSPNQVIISRIPGPSSKDIARDLTYIED